MGESRHVTVSNALALAALGMLLGTALAAAPARAGCNKISEQTKTTWRGYQGTVDTVFGRPDAPDPLPIPDPRNVEVGSTTCNPAQLFGEDYVVVVVFTPPRGGPPNFVALTAQADCSPLSHSDCQRSDVHCVCGANAGILVNPTTNRVRFRFPDTSFTGPATIAVMPYGKSFSLPWQLATQRCQDPGGPADLFACVDEIFDVGSCGTARGDLDPTFGHFTALPPMNDWQNLCEKSGWPWPFNDPDPKCKNQGVDLLFTVDRAGNALIPVSWEGVIEEDSPGVLKNRAVEGQTDTPKAKGGTNPVVIPADALLASYAPNGDEWSYEVEFHEASQSGWLALRGQTDVPESVLRIARRQEWTHECSGGGNAGQACHPEPATKPATDDCPEGTCILRSQPAYFACAGGSEAGSYCTHSDDCPGGQCTPGSACVAMSGQPAPPPPPPKSNPPCLNDAACNPDEECGVGLFEFRDRLENGVGPVVIKKGKYKAKAGKYEPK